MTYKVTAKIDAPWHIYKYSKKQLDNGPKYTEFDFFDPAGLKLEGDWSPSVLPTKKKEPAFPDIPFLEYHEDEVTWSIKLQVPAEDIAGQEDPPMPGRLHDLLGRELQLPRPVDPARRRVDRDSRPRSC